MSASAPPPVEPRPGTTRSARGWAISIGTLLTAIALASTAIYVQHLKTELVRTMAVEDAARYSEALQEFRTLYTSEVVERAMTQGTFITHDYLDHPGSLPLPATLSMLLGNRLTEKSGGHVRLYSDHPFPHREAEQQTLDEVEKKSLDQLRENPHVPVYQFEKGPSGMQIRYATADLMRPSCVHCHNTHPTSPKTDWQVGDVRGVLQVTQPLGAVAQQVSLELNAMVWVLLAVAVLSLGVLGLTANRLRLQAENIQQWARALSHSNEELEHAIEIRIEAEEERDRVTREALYSQKLESLGLLAGGIAHDFNNLLVTILGGAELALPHVTQDSAAHGYLTQVKQGGEKASDLTQQLLAYAGQTPHQSVALDLNQRIEHLLPLLTTATERRGQLLLELEQPIPLILGDPTQLEQVLLNLVTNAAESLDAKQGQITIRTGSFTSEPNDPTNPCPSPSDTDTYVFLEVEDTGCGINEEDRTKIFDPFFSTKSVGRGLGLAALKGIMNSHGAGVLVASTPGKGSIFRLVFPVTSDALPVEAPEKLQAQLQGDGLSVLIVDDNFGARSTTSELLRSRGFQVSESESGAQGLEILRSTKSPVDFVLLDMSMPEMDGMETFRRLKEEWPALRVVFISGYTADMPVHQLVQEGRAQFVSKPFTLDHLVRTLLDYNSA